MAKWFLVPLAFVATAAMAQAPPSSPTGQPAVPDSCQRHLGQVADQLLTYQEALVAAQAKVADLEKQLAAANTPKDDKPAPGPK